MKRILFFCFLLFSISLVAQNTTIVTPLSSPTSVTDSSKIKAAQLIKKHLKHKKFIQAADTLSKSDYLMSIDRVNDDLIDIRDSAKMGSEIVDIKHKIEKISRDFDQIQLTFKDRHTKVNIKNLYLYQTFATNLDEKNDRIMDHLQKLYLRVYHSKLRVKTVLKDSVFKVLYADSLLRNAFDYKLSGLERKWTLTDSLTKLNIDSINTMKVKAVDNSLNLTNMISLINRKLERANQRLFGQELNYLWQDDKNFSTHKDSAKTLLDTEQKAISFYISQTWVQRFFIMICGLLLFLWLFLKLKLLKTIKGHQDDYAFLNLKYLDKLPFLSPFVLLLGLMPFFEVYAPTSYVSIEYFLLLVASTIIIFRIGERTLRFEWLMLTLLLVLQVLSYLLTEPILAIRLFMLVVYVLCITFTYRFIVKQKKQSPHSNWIILSAFIGILLTVMAIIANLMGRLSLSYSFGLAGIFAVTQAVVLPILIDTIFEMILVQLVFSRQKKGVDKPFDSSVVINKIEMPILFVAVLLWLVMLASNLNIYHTISNYIVDTLTDKRTIGSISFKWISVLMFFAIIWFAHILQRLLSFLFGETGLENEDSTTVTKGQHSRLLITRLLVLIGGYLLAIAASGLPIDKLTFLLGALGVGIGMGLQNVVNNFVSGIILIFDGSLQIGDEIEVSGQAGKVKEIGLRASTLSTADGADVIIPNGNILSQNIVNWTFSNDQKRVIIGFSLTGTELDANVINEIINDIIKDIPHVIAKRKPVILYNKVTGASCTLTVRFWSIISKADTVKSDAMLQLNKAFAAKGIGFD